MSCSNNPSGRRFKCSVRLPSFKVHSPRLTNRASRRNALYGHISLFKYCLKTYPMRSPGFLPVIYTWLKSRRHPVPNQSDSGPDSHNKFDLPQPLQGWKILLLWIPAACDLTGTTVSLPNIFACSTPSNLTLFHLVDECWPPLYTRLNFSNDTWRSGLVRRHFQCCIPPSPPLALSVYIPFRSMLQIYLPLFQDGYRSSSSWLVWPWLVIAVH